MTIDKNIVPYFDDFTSNAGFQQILFKPGYAVQARELTQSQSILRDQIAKFGNHIFKHGSVVLPGNVGFDVTVSSVKVIQPIPNAQLYVGGDVTGASGLKAKIRAIVPPTANDMYTTLFVSYYNTGDMGERIFGNTEGLLLNNSIQNIEQSTTTTVSENASTGAVMAFINDGVFYINGSFVEVKRQSIVISKYSAVANCMVLLEIIESIVSAEDDTSLYDPARGSYNYAAPGADRIKIELKLTSLALGSVIGENYVELMRFDNGNIQEFSRYPKYNELEKSLARRTFDESGNYIANGLKLTVHESIKKPFNGGKVVGGSPDDFSIAISSGKAYISGFESESLYPQLLIAPKGRSVVPNHIKSKSISIAPNFGQYIYVTNLKSLPSFINRTTINLFNTISSNTLGVSIGTATVIAIDLHEANSTDQTNIYKLYITNVLTTSDISKIGSISFPGGSADIIHKLIVPSSGVDFISNEQIDFGSTTAKVSKWVKTTSVLYVYKYSVSDIPYVGVKVLGATSGASGIIKSAIHIESNILSCPIIQLPVDAIYKVKSNTGSFTAPTYQSNISYKVFKEISIIVTGGTGSATISGGTIDPLDVGNIIVTSADAVIPISSVSLSSDGTTIKYTGTAVNGSLIKILCSVTKTNVANKSKTFTSNISNPDSGLVPSNTVLLTRADVYRLIGVISTVDGDVTDRFKLNNGQTDYAYLRGSLLLTGVMPTGTLTATYEYFIHSGTGDFFSIDSYANSGLSDFYNNLRPYRSKSNSFDYDLRNSLDFRPKFDSENSTIDMLIIDSRITTDIQYYVPRIDTILLNKTGEAYVSLGVPSEVPRETAPPEETIILGSLYIPAYTYSVSNIVINPSKSIGYKMRDIQKIEDRLFNVEQYSLLTQTESTLINNDIIDATTGLSRFKSGYLVETFANPEYISDINNTEFKASYINNELRPAMEQFAIDMEFVSTTGTFKENAINKNKLITIPYSTDIFATQNRSSRITNINPFSVFSWKGGLQLVPSVDNFVIMNILPPVNEVINNVVYETNVVDVPRKWAFQPEVGSMVSFAPVTQALIEATGKHTFSEALTQAIEWHVGSGETQGSTNPKDYWWVP